MTAHLDPATLIDYLHHELSPADDARAFAHLAQCGECTNQLQAERAVGDALRSAANAQALELPSIVKAGIWERVRNERPAVRWWDVLLRPALAVPVAASVAIGAALTVPALVAPAPSPRIGVSYYLQQHATSRVNPLNERGTAPSVLFDESDATMSPPIAALLATAGEQNPAER